MFAHRIQSRGVIVEALAYRKGFWLLLGALVVLMYLAATSAPAKAWSSRCYIWNSRASFRMPSSGFISGSVPLFLNSDCTPPAEGSLGAGKYGAVEAGDRASAIAKCNSRNGYSNKVKPFGRLYSCNPQIDDDDDSSGGGSTGSSSSKSSSRSARRRIVKPAGPPTGELIQRHGIKVYAELGLRSGIQFQRRDAGAIGIRSVIEMGVLDVVDVWGNIGGDYEVCFPQIGAIVFLDAANSPRTVESVEFEHRDGMTCATLDRAGMLVLVSAAPSTAAVSPSGTPQATTQLSATPQPTTQLSKCEVTTLYNLNLRDAPDGGAVLTIIAYQTLMTSTQRTDNWFFVSFDDLTGWIAARYVITYGRCRSTIIA